MILPWERYLQLTRNKESLDVDSSTINQNVSTEDELVLKNTSTELNEDESLHSDEKCNISENNTVVENKYLNLNNNDNKTESSLNNILDKEKSIPVHLPTCKAQTKHSRKKTEWIHVNKYF